MSVSLVQVHEQTYTWQVATEIRAAAARAMISQRELGEALGLSQMAISRRFRGETAFDVEELAAVSALLDVPIDDLLPRPHTYMDPVEQVRKRAVRRQGLEPRTRCVRDYAPVYQLPDTEAA